MLSKSLPYSIPCCPVQHIGSTAPAINLTAPQKQSPATAWRLPDCWKIASLSPVNQPSAAADDESSSSEYSLAMRPSTISPAATITA